MQKVKFYISLLGTLVMLYIMSSTGRPLKTPTTPHGIIDLEFANNQTKADVILTAWAQKPTETFGLINVAKINTYWDFLFLFFYGWLLFNICRLIYQRLPNSYGKVGLAFGRLGVLAALLDVVENGFMLGVLNGSYSASGLTIMVTVSMLKWAIVAAVILYSLIGLLMSAKRPAISKLTN